MVLLLVSVFVCLFGVSMGGNDSKEMELIISRLRVVIEEGGTATLTWKIKTESEAHQLKSEYDMVLVTPTGEQMSLSLGGESLQLPFEARQGQYVVTMKELPSTHAAWNQMEIKLDVHNASFGNRGDYRFETKSRFGKQNVKASIELIVVKIPTMFTREKKLVYGKNMRGSLKWFLEMEGDPYKYLTMNKELVFTIIKHVNDEKIVLFQKSAPNMLRLPPFPNRARKYYGKMWSVSWFDINLTPKGKMLFTEQVGITIASLTADDTGNYSLEVKLPFGDRRMEKTISLKVLDCFHGSCYEFHSSSSGDWQHNRKKCQIEGGDLARLETGNEWKFIRKILQTTFREKNASANQQGLYIGLKKPQTRQQWRWIRTDYFVNFGKEQWDHTKVTQGPAVPNADELCMVISIGNQGNVGKLRPLSCSTKSGYICELPKRN